MKIDADRTELLALLDEIAQHHRKTIEKMVDVDAYVRKCSDLEELADVAYVMRECSKYHESLRKESDKLRSLIARIFTVLWASSPVHSTVKGQLCSAIPDPKTNAIIPKPTDDPERYARLMKALGVDDEAIKHGMLRISWRELGDYVTELKKKGEPLPDGIDEGKTFTEFRLKIYVRHSPRRDDEEDHDGAFEG